MLDHEQSTIIFTFILLLIPIQVRISEFLQARLLYGMIIRCTRHLICSIFD